MTGAPSLLRTDLPDRGEILGDAAKGLSDDPLPTTSVPCVRRNALGTSVPSKAPKAKAPFHLEPCVRRVPGKQVVPTPTGAARTTAVNIS
ncbi:MAG: hypothetical protein ACLVDB_10905 [Anaeromassilibacillus sp.]